VTSATLPASENGDTGSIDVLVPDASLIVRFLHRSRERLRSRAGLRDHSPRRLLEGADHQAEPPEPHVGGLPMEGAVVDLLGDAGEPEDPVAQVEGKADGALCWA
jgi:hypothetical protein